MLASGASAQSQQFCVKWNSYSTNLQSVFPRLLTSEHFVDLTLACEGRMIKCHKVVLSACSTYFERLLVQNPCQHPIIFMKDMKHWEVQALVDFMYKGEVNVSQDELNSLLVAAEALQIRGLCGSQQQQHHQSQQQSNLAQSSASTVQLPHDTVLSGGGGRESPPSFKRRRNQEDEAHSTPKISMSPSLNSRHSLSSDMNSHHINQQHTSSSERYSDHQEQHSDKKIKQEVEVEDNYLEGEVDVEEDFTNLEHPEDSDSNNREDAQLDQPGPSGLASSNPPSMDKAVTGLVRFRAPRRSYSSSSLWQALMDVKMGESIYSSAKLHGIPRKTLRNWMQRWNIKTVAWPPKVRPYRQYTNDNLWAALMDVKCGGSVYRASKEHGIPRKTLRNWMKRWNIKSKYAAPTRKVEYAVPHTNLTL